MPTVSIIIPTYNRAHYLREALDSVLAQTYQDWEVIVVDDGSTDDTQELVREYQERCDRVRYLYQDKKNASAARNLGIAHARGRYIAFLDDDDVFLQNKLDVQLSYFTSPEVKMTYSYYEVTDEYEKWMIQSIQPPVRMDGKIYPELLTIRGNWIVTPAVIVEKEAVLEVGLFDETMTDCEDIDLWRRIAMRWTVRVVDQALVRIRLRIYQPKPLMRYARARVQLYEKACMEDPNLRGSYHRFLNHEMYQFYAIAAIRDQKRILLAILFQLRALYYGFRALYYGSWKSAVVYFAKKIALQFGPVRRYVENHRAVLAERDGLRTDRDALREERDMLRAALAHLQARIEESETDARV